MKKIKAERASLQVLGTDGDDPRREPLPHPFIYANIDAYVPGELRSATNVVDLH